MKTKRKPRLTTQSNPRMLDLLRMGCKITLPDGRYLNGDPSTAYISIGNEVGHLGLWSLDREGLRNALSDRDFQPPSESDE